MDMNIDIDRLDNDFVYVDDIKLFIHSVTSDEAMRLSKVCFNYYGSSNYLVELMYINGIVNYFSIKEDYLLLLPGIDDIDRVFDFSSGTINDIRDKIVEVNKRRRKRKNKSKKNDRKSENDKRMPPHIVNNNKIEVRDGKMIIKPNF